jgi:hypothetical protein
VVSRSQAFISAAERTRMAIMVVHPGAANLFVRLLGVS